MIQVKDYIIKQLPFIGIQILQIIGTAQLVAVLLVVLDLELDMEAQFMVMSIMTLVVLVY